jgi:hypothetical protein
MALGEERATDIMIVMGDFNSSTGTSSGANDLVCGPHGNPHQDGPGRKLKATAAMMELVDLTTWEEQMMVNTHYDITSRSGRQIDRAFVTIQDRQMVVKCVNAAMTVESDHECVKNKMIIEKTEKPLKTKRKGRQQKDAGSTFGMDADPKLRAEAAAKVLERHENSAAKSSAPHSTFEALVNAVTTTLDGVQDKERKAKGWCDANDWVLEIAIAARTVASRKYALHKTDPCLKMFREARSQVVKVKRMAKNI